MFIPLFLTESKFRVASTRMFVVKVTVNLVCGQNNFCKPLSNKINNDNLLP